MSIGHLSFWSTKIQSSLSKNVHTSCSEQTEKCTLKISGKNLFIKVYINLNNF